MKRIGSTLLILFLSVFIVTGCSEGLDRLESFIGSEKSKSVKVTEYAEEVGFSLTTPTKQLIEAETIVDIEGQLDPVENNDWDHIWVVLTPEEKEEETDVKIKDEEFNYYFTVEDGMFSGQMTLHQGAGLYVVSIWVPSNLPFEDGLYYDVAAFSVLNEDTEVQREVEYTEHGVEQGMLLTSPSLGLGENDGTVLVEGTVSEDYQGEMIIVGVEKDGEAEQVILPIQDHTFAEEIPLYFGEGLHTVSIQMLGEDEELHYEAATFYANNQVNSVFADITKFTEYMSRGVMVNEPTWNTAYIQESLEYPIAGEIDSTIPGAEEISYIIVTVIHLEEEEESVYLIPVEDYTFDGIAYFRFGPGEYNVMLSVPELEQKDQSMFYYQGVMQIAHEVVDVADERGQLPSRGIESDDATIVEKAEEITKGLEGEREKAKAIYKFVAQHVAYDVEKAESDTFNIDDSALSTLESGNGICQDYAFLTTALLRAVGMESHYVSGEAGERHAWVEVKVDDEWLEMDPTWGAGYVQNGTFHFHYTEDYFDPDPAFLAETHTRDGIMY